MILRLSHLRNNDDDVADLLTHHVYYYRVLMMTPLTHHVDYYGVPEEEGERKEHPGQVGRLEVKQPEEVHADVGVASTPHVHQHDGERLAQKHQIHKQGNYLRCHGQGQHSTYCALKATWNMLLENALSKIL